MSKTSNDDRIFQEPTMVMLVTAMAKRKKLIVCTKGKHCRKRGSKKVFCALEQEIEDQGLENQIQLKKSSCLGLCKVGPAVQLKPDKLFYGSVLPSDCAAIVDSALRKTPQAV